MENEAGLIGRLGKDPELKTTINGNQICTFSLATTEKWKTKEGERKEQTQWHNIVCYGKLAEIAHEYGNKGDLARVKGKITYSESEKEGVKKYYTNIEAKTVLYLNTKDKPTQGEQKRMQSNSAMAKDYKVETDASFTADDIPF